MYLIGIAGGSGSGKTTFTKKILRHFKGASVAHLHQDSYYLPNQPAFHFVKGQPNFDHPDAFDWELLRKHILDLKTGKAVATPKYDYKKSTRTEKTELVGPAKVVVFEGIYTFWDQAIRDALDLKVYLHIDADIRFIRRLHRDVKERARNLDSIINQYYDTVRPMHRQFLEPTKQYADLVVGEETDKPATVVADHIRAVLK